MIILKNVLKEKVIEYLYSDHWKESLEMLLRGRDNVLHAHIYLESILHPDTLEKIFVRYFEKINRPLERKVWQLSDGKGSAIIYYLQPKGICHFEIYSLYNPDTIITPTLKKKESIEYWDTKFMENYYTRFQFKSMDDNGRKDVEKYFQSTAWNQIYGLMVYDLMQYIHCHNIVETSFHPEEILPIGKKAIEDRGYRVDRSVSVVFFAKELGKITYLLAEPETVIELEWEHNPNVSIKQVALARIKSAAEVMLDLSGIEYLYLDDEDIETIIEHV